MSITEHQAQKLQLQAHTRWSPYLEKCCLLLSANESYERASEDIQVLTGIAVSRGTQQRLVHRQTFELPISQQPVEEMSIDGGKVRLRTPQGEPCQYRDYKAVNLHHQSVGAFFQDNSSLTSWVNQHSFSTPLICLGDGHDGIWNLFAEISNPSQRQEILDWYHLMENLGKVDGPKQLLDAVEARLWQGDVDGAIELFEQQEYEHVEQFIAHLNKHRPRIVDYSYFQAEGMSIGSGEIESTVKQIARRVKISGAQWLEDNVPQVLQHRCAYLNGQFST